MKNDIAGSRANHAGRTAEQVLAYVLSRQGITVKSQWIMGKNIYGGDLRVDLFVEGLASFPTGLAIESKWQDVKGSVDEKLPYLVTNIKQSYPLVD